MNSVDPTTKLKNPASGDPGWQSVRVIYLTRGQFTLVDHDLYDELNQHKWRALRTRSGNFYAGACLPKMKLLLMHRLILNAQPGQIVDHKNRDPLDNRRANLRFVTPSQSNLNRRLISTANKSGFRGVHWAGGRANKWKATIGIDKRLIHLGYFDTPEAAAAAFDAAARKIHGGFSPLNFADINPLNSDGDSLNYNFVKWIYTLSADHYLERIEQAAGGFDPVLFAGKLKEDQYRLEMCHKALSALRKALPLLESVLAECASQSSLRIAPADTQAKA